MGLCDIQDIKALLGRHGFRFSKSMGQNFLIADWVPRDIAEASGAAADCGGGSRADGTRGGWEETPKAGLVGAWDVRLHYVDGQDRIRVFHAAVRCLLYDAAGKPQLEDAAFDRGAYFFFSYFYGEFLFKHFFKPENFLFP